MLTPHGFKAFVKRRHPSTTEQQALAKQARVLLDSPAWQLVEELLEAQAQYQLSLLRPPAVREQAEYASGHGLVEGLRSARMAINALTEVAESADERAKSAAESAR